MAPESPRRTGSSWAFVCFRELPQRGFFSICVQDNNVRLPGVVCLRLAASSSRRGFKFKLVRLFEGCASLAMQQQVVCSTRVGMRVSARSRSNKFYIVTDCDPG